MDYIDIHDYGKKIYFILLLQEIYEIFELLATLARRLNFNVVFCCWK